MHKQYQIMRKRYISLKHAILHLESLMHIQEIIQVINANSSSKNHIHHKTNHTRLAK